MTLRDLTLRDLWDQERRRESWESYHGRVCYESGEARDVIVVNASGNIVCWQPYEFCDYMVVVVPNSEDEDWFIELYAQLDPNDYGYENGENPDYDDRATHDDLQSMILDQADEYGIDKSLINFDMT